MTSNIEYRTRTGMRAGLVCSVIFLLAGFCFSQPAISLSPKEGPPTTSLRVSGSGFAPNAKIDIYFGTHDEAAAMANSKGSFFKIAILAPASALPGSHWVSAVESSGHVAARAAFLVRTNWVEFHRHNMRRLNPYENVLNVNNVASLYAKWSYTTGNGISSGPTGPAVAFGVVYFGSYPNGKVYAVNAKTGALLWRYATAGGIVSSPAIANGVVYIGSRDSNVYALNASTGAKLWSYATTDYVDSFPAVASGVVYVGGGDQNVYALNARTGALLWSYPTAGYVRSSPAVANGVVYIGSADRRAFALNARTGALLWSHRSYGGNVSPAVADGVVYFPSDNGKVYALGLNAATSF